jgi:hypothetical protein
MASQATGTGKRSSAKGGGKGKLFDFIYVVIKCVRVYRPQRRRARRKYRRHQHYQRKYQQESLKKTSSQEHV